MRRKAKGNMLVMSGVFISVNALALVVVSSFGSLFFVHSRLQTMADELALLGAKQINQQNCVGQMNNMIARSRQLVNDSQSSDDEVHTSIDHLSQLADQLHTEAREGAMLLEQERHQLGSVSAQQARDITQARYNAIKQGQSMSLPWLQVSVPNMQIELGRLKGVQSNVAELTGISALDDQDKAQYIATDGSKLYKNDINAKLTGNDADLSFKLSSLPAPVPTVAGNNLPASKYLVAPARTALANKFIPANPDSQIYTATHVTINVEVSTGLGPSSHSTIQVNSAAEADGGQPMM